MNIKDLDKPKRQEFDSRLAQSAREAEPNRPRSRAPGWWKGEVAATSSSLEAARQMGFNVTIGNLG